MKELESPSHLAGAIEDQKVSALAVAEERLTEMRLNLALAHANNHSSQQKPQIPGSSKPPQVAIKQLNKDKIKEIENGIEFLLNEIKVHWALEQCVSVVRLL